MLDDCMSKIVICQVAKMNLHRVISFDYVHIHPVVLLGEHLG